MPNYRESEGQFQNQPKPELTVSDVEKEYRGRIFHHEDRAADFINERRLNRVDKSKGESVAKNLKKAMDVTNIDGEIDRARKKSLNKTHNPFTNQPYSSYEKYGDKYAEKDE